MTISADTIWEVRSDGNDENGGGFVEGASGVDFSQQAVAQLTLNDVVTNGTTTITSATGGFTSDMVGNLTYLDGSWYYIVSFVSSNSVVIDASVGAAAGLTLRVGGALASLGGLGRASNGGQGALQYGKHAYVRGGTYVQASMTANVPGGLMDWNNFATGRILEGYSSVRNDGGRPVIDLGVLTSAYSMDLASSRNTQVFNFDFHCNGNSGTNPFGNSAGGGDSHHVNLVCRDAGDVGFDATATQYYRCVALNCGGDGFNTNSTIHRCLSYGNGGDGIITSRDIGHCIALKNTGDGINTSFSTHVLNCVSVLNGGDGFHLGSSRDHAVRNCLSVRNGIYGFDLDNNNADRAIYLDNCALFGNTGGAFDSFHVSLTGKIVNTITLTADPFVDADNDDYQINEVDGGGALLRESQEDFEYLITSPYLWLLDELPGGIFVTKKKFIR